MNTHSIAVDAKGDSSTASYYRGALVSNGKILFEAGPFREMINHVAKFLAITHALVLIEGGETILELENSPIVYCDSNCAVTWATRKCVTSGKSYPEPVYKLIKRAEEWLFGHRDMSSRIRKWDTKNWGVMPGDYNPQFKKGKE